MLRVTVRDLASMAATPAGWGRHLRHRVGMPAKSGVSGALMAVAPGTLGLAGHSPPLDEHGNSVRGVAAFETVADELGLHRSAPPDWAHEG